MFCKIRSDTWLMSFFPPSHCIRFEAIWILLRTLRIFHTFTFCIVSGLVDFFVVCGVKGNVTTAYSNSIFSIIHHMQFVASERFEKCKCGTALLEWLLLTLV